MSEKKSYKASLERLQEIVESLEEGSEDLELLQSQVKEASELLLFCKGKLRGAEKQLEKTLKSINSED